MNMVFAGTYAQAVDFAKVNELAPREWCYVDSPRTIMGLRRGSNIYMVGTYSSRSDFVDVLDVVKSRDLRQIRIPT